MISGNVDTLQYSLLLVIHLLLLDSIVNPVLIIVNGGLSLLMVGNSLLNLMPIEALSIAVILSLVLLENLYADIHLVIDDELEVNLIFQVLELRCVDPFDFFSLILPTVLQKILSNVLDDVYFLLHLEFEDGNLEDVDGHVLLNHLLICQVRKLFDVIVRFFENECLSVTARTDWCSVLFIELLVVYTILKDTVRAIYVILMLTQIHAYN